MISFVFNRPLGLVMLILLTVNLSQAQEEAEPNLSAFFESLAQHDASAVEVADILDNAFEITKSQREVGMALLDSLEKYIQYNGLTKENVFRYEYLKTKTLLDNYSFPAANISGSFLKGQLKLSNEENRFESDIGVYYTLGDLSLANQTPDSALVYYETGRLLASNAQDSLNQWIGLNKKSIVYEMFGAYDNVVRIGLQAISIAESLKDQKKILTSTHSIAGGYRGFGEYELASKFYFEEIEMLSSGKDSVAIAFAYSNLATNYFYQKSTLRAIKYVRMSMEILDLKELQFYQTGLWILLARSLIQNGELEEGQKSLEVGRQMANDQGFIEANVQGLFGQFELDLANGKIKEAEKNLLEAIAITIENPLQKSRLMGYDLLVDFYKNNRLFPEAFQAKAEHSRLVDSIYQVQKSLQIVELQTQYETTKKEELINIRTLELDIQKAQKNKVVVVLILALFLLVVLVYFYLQVKRTRDKLRIQNELVSSQNNELDVLNSTKDKFFSIIAHDLRSPMIGLQGVGQKLEYFIKKNRQQKLLEMGGQIDRSIDQLNHLLDNLLNWASSQTGGIPYSPQLHSIVPLIQENMELYRPLAKSKDITLKCEVGDDEVYADMNAVSTVIRNLLSNAIKFTERNSTVLLRSCENDGMLDITVLDQGNGMSLEKAESLFENSEFSTTAGTEGEKGFGLGLKLCKEFTEMNHGVISVNSEEGKGTSFIVSFPRSAKGF
jgi:signal transduction histidine kinase